jgi:uncharacterized repeat protein (TIGR03803 family)
VFEIVKTTTGYASTPSILVSFDGTDGADPRAGLIEDAFGNLFGTTLLGGVNGDGTVFEIANNGTVANPSYASTPTTLINFGGINGAFSYATLIADHHGDLFGTTNGGGANNNGTVFEISNSGFVEVAAAPDRMHVQVGGSVSADAVHGVLANDTVAITGDTLNVSAVDGVQSDFGQPVDGSYGSLLLAILRTHN